MGFGDSLSRRGLIAGAAALGMAPLVGAAVAEDVLALGGFRVMRAAPGRGASGAPVLVWLPVASGPVAPIHLGFARRLARRGYQVLTPELRDRRTGGDLAALIALAVRMGGGGPGLGVIGYDGGMGPARTALTIGTAVRAALVYPGALAANPVTRARPDASLAPDARLLEHPGVAGLEAAAEAALTGGLAWLAARGLGGLS